VKREATKPVKIEAAPTGSGKGVVESAPAANDTKAGVKIKKPEVSGVGETQKGENKTTTKSGMATLPHAEELHKSKDGKMSELKVGDGPNPKEEQTQEDMSTTTTGQGEAFF
jgi:hypothetical protein